MKKRLLTMAAAAGIGAAFVFAGASAASAEEVDFSDAWGCSSTGGNVWHCSDNVGHSWWTDQPWVNPYYYENAR